MNTNGSLRAMWKYASAKGVSGTPTAFVNGAKLDDTPMTLDSWTKLIDQVKASQWSPPASYL